MDLDLAAAHFLAQRILALQLSEDLLGIALPVLAYRAGMLVRNLDECWNRHRPVRSRWRAPGAPIV
jgi:hypothetical protein